MQETAPTALPDPKTIDDVMPQDMTPSGMPDMSDIMPEQFPGT